MAREPIKTRPDVLVLGAGGTLGIEWLRGVLAGLEDEAGIDMRGCEYLVGTSAGSVVAAALQAGLRPASQRPGHRPAVPDGAAESSDGSGALTAALGWSAAATSPIAPIALAVSRRGGALVRAAALRAAPRPRGVADGLRRQLEGLGANFDGRLRIVAVDRANGKRVVFGSPGSPRATVAQAALASCSVPWLFAPVRIGDRDYVDGGVWSPSNIDAAPAGRGAQVLCLLPLLALGAESGGVMRLARTGLRAAAFAEVQALRARGASVRVEAPDADAARAIGPNPMDARRVRNVFDEGWRQGRRLAGP